MFSRSDTEEIRDALDEHEEEIEVIEEDDSGISDFFSNKSYMPKRPIVSRLLTEQKRNRIGKEEIADIIKRKFEQDNPDETIPRRTYRYIIDEVYFAIAQELLRGNEVSIYPIGVLSPGSSVTKLSGKIDNWFFTYIRLKPNSDFRKKLRLYELSRATKEERELFKEALKKLPETDFGLGS